VKLVRLSKQQTRSFLAAVGGDGGASWKRGNIAPEHARRLHGKVRVYCRKSCTGPAAARGHLALCTAAKSHRRIPCPAAACACRLAAPCAAVVPDSTVLKRVEERIILWVWCVAVLCT
jgi:hypothetical protein